MILLCLMSPSRTLTRGINGTEDWQRVVLNSNFVKACKETRKEKFSQKPQAKLSIVGWRDVLGSEGCHGCLGYF